jgi:hypothetical protein
LQAWPASGADYSAQVRAVNRPRANATVF